MKENKYHPPIIPFPGEKYFISLIFRCNKIYIVYDMLNLKL